MAVQSTILYVPFNSSARGQWTLRRGAELVGHYATREEALMHATALSCSIKKQMGQDAEIRIEDELGAWRAHRGGDAVAL
ncbi:surfactin synthase thioesterase subunit [Luteibacter sp. Sphag1AF]|uniref:hypothetical protein n=1 Tax=Luteibacter sp. Sphag1AF TaxID=2587031 RepID=UPI001615DE3A|nr:hypothetical protein [Luteibacter sp. Sphag1AF]MBB3228051.1 surfactin synthase thioesterase subunit [Luteibacter sp. Sphag1AF]